MSLERYKETLKEDLRQATLVFLVAEDRVLLAMKKVRFGKGRYNGAGGKQQDGETIKQTAVREAREEIGVSISIRTLKKMATLDFYQPHNPEWNQRVIVFVVYKWQGEPIETEEMRPEWFPQDKLPFDQMWPDDPYWLAPVLEGKQVTAEFLFNENNQIAEQNVKIED